MLIVALRGSPALAATEYDTDPLLLDGVPAVIASQLALLVALQGHPLAAVTAMLPLAVALV
jgi:hypothetical protein